VIQKTKVFKNMVIISSLALCHSFSAAKKYVLTGGPGNGKTTIIQTLQSRGFKTLPEVATTIIEDAIKQGLPNPTHGNDICGFQEAVAKKQVELESMLNKKDLVFLDRGIIDGLAYCDHHQLISLPPTLQEKTSSTNYTAVFVLDFVEDSYQTDSVRIENLKEALIIHELIIKHYRNLGYSPIFVPAFQCDENGKKLSTLESTAKRAEFILKHISETSYKQTPPFNNIASDKTIDVTVTKNL